MESIKTNPAIMKRLAVIFIVVLIIPLLTSCGSLRPVSIDYRVPLDSYKYFYVTPTGSVIGGSGDSDFYLERSSNAGDIISGYLVKKGFVRLPEIVPDLAERTFVVNYGESGRRNPSLFSSTIEVTIQFLNAKSYDVLCTCSGEGRGVTEADDIRIALTRCLDTVFQ